MALQYVEAQRQARPDLADWYADLADLYQRKLWHQLTLKLDQFLQIPLAQVPTPLRLLHLHFSPFSLEPRCRCSL
jgi:26S proteasome regulatory subunit N9